MTGIDSFTVGVQVLCVGTNEWTMTGINSFTVGI